MTRRQATRRGQTFKIETTQEQAETINDKPAMMPAPRAMQPLVFISKC